MTTAKFIDAQPQRLNTHDVTNRPGVRHQDPLTETLDISIVLSPIVSIKAPQDFVVFSWRAL